MIKNIDQSNRKTLKMDLNTHEFQDMLIHELKINREKVGYSAKRVRTLGKKHGQWV
jgi:hypothetical protein